jgi:OHCU decarboxylase
VGQSTRLPHTALNALPLPAARNALEHCCGARRWVDAMIARRPFESTPELFDAARQLWLELTREDYLEAFAQQPAIGANLTELAKRSPRAARSAAREQSKLARADKDTLARLREANQRYAEHFGYPFVVSAAGKSAQEILQLLAERSSNDPARELAIAAEEMAQITALRLGQLA